MLIIGGDLKKPLTQYSEPSLITRTWRLGLPVANQRKNSPSKIARQRAERRVSRIWARTISAALEIAVGCVGKVYIQKKRYRADKQPRSLLHPRRAAECHYPAEPIFAAPGVIFLLLCLPAADSPRKQTARHSSGNICSIREPR